MRSALILFTLIIASSFAFAQNLKTDKGHENNPYYSNTDTKHLKRKQCRMEKDIA